MNPRRLGTVLGALTLAARTPARPAAPAEARPACITNAIGQQLFVARLVEIRTTRHRRFRWAMTFERLSDGRRFAYEAWDDSPIAEALGFRSWADGQGAAAAPRIAAAPRVLLLTHPARRRAPYDSQEPPSPSVAACFVLDNDVPNPPLRLPDGESEERRPRRAPATEVTPQRPAARQTP